MTTIYSLLFEVHNPTPGASTQIVAPVDEDGLGRHVWPADRTKTLLEVQAGDKLLLRNDRYRITEVRVYRSAKCRNDQPVVACGREFAALD